MSLFVVGSVAHDGVETPHGKVDRMLGGAATNIALAAGMWSVSHQKKPEDLTHTIFPDQE